MDKINKKITNLNNNACFGAAKLYGAYAPNVTIFENHRNIFFGIKFNVSNVIKYGQK